MSRILVILGLFFILTAPVLAGQDTTLTDQGTVYLNQGRYSEAISSFSSALVVNPNNLEARVNKGTALFSSGKPSEALLSFDITLNQDPTYVPALLERGRVLLATEDPKEALDSYKQALQQNPGSIKALEGKGDSLFALDQGGDAIAAWTEALSYDPGNTRLQGKIASARENSGFSIPLMWWIVISLLIVTVASVIYRVLRSSRKGSPPGNNTVRNFLSRKPSSGDKSTKNKRETTKRAPLTGLTRSEVSAPDKEGPLLFLCRIIKRTGPKAVASTGKTLALHGSAGGMGNDRPPDGEPLQFGESGGDLPDIEMNDSFNRSSSSDSVTDITRSLEVLLGTRDDAYTGAGLKGILLYSNGEYEAAIQEFDKEITSYPDGVGVALLKVRALIHLNRFKEAFDLDRHILTLAKNNYEVLVLAASLSEKLGHLEFGLRACNKATSMRHNAADIWALKGKILHKMGNFNEALTSLRQSLDLDTAAGQTWEEYGHVLCKAGWYQEAFGAFENVIVLTGETPQIRDKMKICLEKRDDVPANTEKIPSQGKTQPSELRDPPKKKSELHSALSEKTMDQIDNSMNQEIVPLIYNNNRGDLLSKGANE